MRARTPAIRDRPAPEERAQDHNLSSGAWGPVETAGTDSRRLRRPRRPYACPPSCDTAIRPQPGPTRTRSHTPPTTGAVEPPGTDPGSGYVNSSGGEPAVAPAVTRAAATSETRALRDQPDSPRSSRKPRTLHQTNGNLRPALPETVQTFTRVGISEAATRNTPQNPARAGKFGPTSPEPLYLPHEPEAPISTSAEIAQPLTKGIWRRIHQSRYSPARRPLLNT